MTNKLPRSPILPAPGVDPYDLSLHSALYQHFMELLGIGNLAILSDGSNKLERPVVLATYTVAGVPTASLWTAGVIYVSNEVGGAVPAFSDGANWRRVTDRVVIS